MIKTSNNAFIDTRVAVIIYAAAMPAREKQVLLGFLARLLSPISPGIVSIFTTSGIFSRKEFLTPPGAAGRSALAGSVFHMEPALIHETDAQKTAAPNVPVSIYAADRGAVTDGSLKYTR